VVLGLHYPSDVLVGAALGASLASGALAIAG
jgi:membrane-associated phospholipid phosphatase